MSRKGKGHWEGGEQLTTEDVSALVAFMDVDGDQSIDFHEFTMGFMEEKQLVTEAKMRLAFDFFDTDHNGRIDIRAGPPYRALPRLHSSPSLASCRPEQAFHPLLTA